MVIVKAFKTIFKFSIELFFKNKIFSKIILLMCALTEYFFLRIEKVLTIFSIFNKIFLKIDCLICEGIH